MMVIVQDIENFSPAKAGVASQIWLTPTKPKAIELPMTEVKTQTLRLPHVHIKDLRLPVLNLGVERRPLFDFLQ